MAQVVVINQLILLFVIFFVNLIVYIFYISFSVMQKTRGTEEALPAPYGISRQGKQRLL